METVMKDLKRKLAVLLTLCLVLTGAAPAYAEEMMLPETAAEAVAAEAIAAEAVEAEPAEDEAVGEEPKELAEKAEGTVLASDAAGTICVLISCEWNSRTYREVGTNAKLSNILAALGISGSISGTPTSSDENLFKVEQVSGDWIVTPVSSSETAGTLTVTAGDSPYEILILVKAAVRKDVVYIDENGNEQTAKNCIVMSSSFGADDYSFEAGEWYVAEGTFTVRNRIENKAPEDDPAHIILGYNAILRACQGIHNPHGNGLVIYNHSLTGPGQLIAEASDNTKYSAGIGGDENQSGGSLIINGGIIQSTGGYFGAAGIGGGYSGCGGTIVINGGTVTANGGNDYGGAGIGGGVEGAGAEDGKSITIHGGTVIANGGVGGSGIGGGARGAGTTGSGRITISGGTVTAAGGDGSAGIGGGYTGCGGTIVINDGTVTAKGGNDYGGAGIGGGAECAGAEDGKSITIHGGTVIANGGAGGSGIGGGAGGAGTTGSGHITISGGIVTAAGGDGSAGIGGGIYGGAGGTVTVSGGKVTAKGGPGAAGIGGSRSLKGRAGSGGGTVTITGGEVIAVGINTGGIDGGYQATNHGTLSVDDSLEILAGNSENEVRYQSLELYSFNRDPYAEVSALPSYLVRYLKEKADGIGYEEAETETIKGHSGEKTKAAFKLYEGFTPLPFEQQTVKSDSSTVVDIHYDRLKYTFVFDSNGHGKAPAAITARYGETITKPADPAAEGYIFGGWYEEEACTTPYTFTTMPLGGKTVYAKWTNKVYTKYTITWKDWDGKTLATVKVEEGGLPKYPGASKPSRSGYNFTGWTPEIDLAYADMSYTATYAPQTVINGGGGGGGSVPAAKKAAVTFSPNWYVDSYGVWRIKNSAGQVVTNAWLCDDAVAANGQNVWYLLTQDGAMLASGLVQDNTGNFYSLETNHDGYFGMLRYTDGYYNCNGQQVYLKFSKNHDGTFGAVVNPDGIEKLKAIYGVTKYGIGNENAVYTKTF